MRFDLTILLLVVGMIAIVTPLSAHHPFSTEYDLTKLFFMDGKITKVVWQNPHVDFFIDVTDKTAGTVNWDIEINPPHELQNRGWKKDTLQVGMGVCVEGFPEKTEKTKFGSTSITVKATGQVLETPSADWRTADLPIIFNSNGQVVTAPTRNSKPMLSPQTNGVGSKSVPYPYTGKTSCAHREAR